ncbi:hypothetical protein [Streptomyces sp. NPDC046685]|uniref:hypothetical protein n=1 Tax=Streptomyces sp. NPDC046685 TaxID=3157202 RepID=UPI0033F438DB
MRPCHQTARLLGPTSSPRRPAGPRPLRRWRDELWRGYPSAVRWAADNFTQIANALFRDRRISFKAKGIFGLISTHRAGFTVTVAALVRSSTDGKSAVTTGLQELEKSGYLERGQEHNDDGTFGEAWYRIADVPAHLFDLLGDDATGMLDRVQNRRSEPLDDFPSTDDPATGNRTT